MTQIPIRQLADKSRTNSKSQFPKCLNDLDLKYCVLFGDWFLGDWDF